ncbi:MAG: YveK family protein [Clostridium sp.]
MSEENINIGEILQLLRKRYKIILISILACVSIAGIFSFFVIKPKYESKVKVFVGKEAKSAGASYDNAEIQMYQKLLTTYAELIKTEDLVQFAVDEAALELGGLEAKDILTNLVVTPRSDTQILEVGYKDTDPSRTVLVVQAITQGFMEKSKELIGNGNVKVIQEAKYPHVPVSPNKKMNILISLVLGAMIGVGIVLLLEFIDNTFKTKKTLQDELGIPVLGAIPEYDSEEVKSHYRTSRKEKKKEITQTTA